jgi:hypothetical protein
MHTVWSKVIKKLQLDTILFTIIQQVKRTMLLVLALLVITQQGDTNNAFGNTALDIILVLQIMLLEADALLK